MTGAPRIEISEVTKTFPGVIANDRVSFSVAPGEIHALLGENGAGKSTLVKMIYGLLAPDAGEIRWNGAPVAIAHPRAARRLGVGMVFQHFSLFDAMSVMENVALGLDEAIAPATLEARINEVSEIFGLRLEPHRIVSSLSVGERQRIEIVRALLLEPTLLIMDEPTSVLTPQEASLLFETLRKLAARECSILYISHKLQEIRELCDRATILRGGKVVAECDPKRETATSMAEKMIGGDLKKIAPAAGAELGGERLIVDGLDAPGEVALKGISFSVRAGEIFGVAGVAGNGQDTLLNALSGDVRTEGASIRLEGAPIGAAGPTERRRRGLCAAPEERNGHAAVGAFDLADNVLLSARTRNALVSLGFIRRGAAEAYARDVIARFDVKTGGPRALAGSLSGGNLQKFVIGREILQKPSVLAVSQPTWGVDAGAAAAIHQALFDLAAEGCAIIVISQDLDELLAICDRLAVINEGALSRATRVSDASIEELGLLMGGVHGAARVDEEPAHAS